MLDNRIHELVHRIQRLSNAQVKAFHDAAYLGMTPKVARECKDRRELISKLVDRLARLRKPPQIDSCRHDTRTKSAA
jgi:hypothetical protein